MHRDIARPDRDINHVLAYGQSLSVGYEGWPALSTSQPHDSLMLGDCVRPLRDDAPEWQPVGAPAFRPLRATVQNLGTGALLTDADVAALPPGSAMLGETVLEGALNFWRGRQLAAGAEPGRQRLLASSCGTGGRTLEALSKGASPELFNRLRACVRLASSVAAENKASYGITAVLFLQGESNNWGLDGSAAEVADYKALLQVFRRDVFSDLSAGITLQPAPPSLFLYQTGGAYASETQSVPQAQLEFALETPGCFLVAPSYPVTEKFGHLDANGYRWLGVQFGKVLHRVLTLGQDWRPLHPRRADFSGDAVLVDFHVPVPPLRWGRPIVGHGFVDPHDRGFTVIDAAGTVPIARVDIVGPASVRLALARPANGAAILRYADRQHGGRGALHDSDADSGPDCYAYDPGIGHYPDADIPELVGRPYPLMNWCVAFSIPIGAAAPASLTGSPAWDFLRRPGHEGEPTQPAPRRSRLAALWRALTRRGR